MKFCRLVKSESQGVLCLIPSLTKFRFRFVVNYCISIYRNTVGGEILESGFLSISQLKLVTSLPPLVFDHADLNFSEDLPTIKSYSPVAVITVG